MECGSNGQREELVSLPDVSSLPQHQESLLRGRFAPSGHIEGFTAEIGASGSYCPQHVTLPVTVTFFDVSEQNSPAPFLVRYNTFPKVTSGGVGVPEGLLTCPFYRSESGSDGQNSNVG